MYFLLGLPLSFEGMAVIPCTFVFYSFFILILPLIWVTKTSSFPEIKIGAFQGKSEQMIEYIKKLKICVKWFMELEDGYQTEQGMLRNLCESEEKRHAEMGIFTPSI